jgi:hypothetical protein
MQNRRVLLYSSVIIFVEITPCKIYVFDLPPWMYFLNWLFCSIDLKSVVFKSVILFFVLSHQQKNGESKK